MAESQDNKDIRSLRIRLSNLETAFNIMHTEIHGPMCDVSKCKTTQFQWELINITSFTFEMKLLICGDRNYTGENQMKYYIENATRLIPYESLAKIDLIIEGGAKGADALAKKIAIEKNIPVAEEKADWLHQGRAAGPIRNQLMLDKYHPDIVLVFHHNITRSLGSRDMMRKAVHAHIPTYLIEREGAKRINP